MCGTTIPERKPQTPLYIMGYCTKHVINNRIIINAFFTNKIQPTCHRLDQHARYNEGIKKGMRLNCCLTHKKLKNHCVIHHA